MDGRRSRRNVYNWKIISNQTKQYNILPWVLLLMQCKYGMANRSGLGRAQTRRRVWRMRSKNRDSSRGGRAGR